MSGTPFEPSSVLITPEAEDFPPAVKVVETEWGSEVYIVGTSHFSKESQQDVIDVIILLILLHRILCLCSLFTDNPSGSA